MPGQPGEEETPPETPTTQVVDNSQTPDNTDWKKRYDDSSKEAKKLVEEKNAKEGMLLNIAVEHVVSNPDYLENLAKEDPDLAEKVVKKLKTDDGEEFDSIEDALKFVKGLKKPWSPEKKVEKTIDTDKLYEEFKKRQEQEQTVSYVEDLFKTIPEDKREEIRNNYNDLIEGKSNLSKEKVKKYFDLVNTYKPKKSDTVDKKMAEMASSGIKNSASSKEYEDVSPWVLALAKQLGKEHLYVKKTK